MSLISEMNFDFIFEFLNFPVYSNVNVVELKSFMPLEWMQRCLASIAQAMSSIFNILLMQSTICFVTLSWIEDVSKKS